MSIQVASIRRSVGPIEGLFAATAPGFGLLTEVHRASTRTAVPAIVRGNPSADGDIRAAYALKAAVRSLTCATCFRDVDGNGGVTAADASRNANRNTDEHDPSSGFPGAFDGDQACRHERFPDVLGDCGVCISPILILQHDVASGSWSMITKNMVR